MLQHVLMPHHEHWHFVRVQQIVNAHQRLEKIHDEIRLRFLDGLPNRREAFPVRRQIADDISQRRRHGNAAMLLERKARAQDRPHRHRERLLKKRRQAPGLIRAGHDRHDLVPTPLEHFAHRDRLRHVTPAFPLHGEHYLHGI